MKRSAPILYLENLLNQEPYTDANDYAKIHKLLKMEESLIKEAFDDSVVLGFEDFNALELDTLYRLIVGTLDTGDRWYLLNRSCKIAVFNRIITDISAISEIQGHVVNIYNEYRELYNSFTPRTNRGRFNCSVDVIRDDEL